MITMFGKLKEKLKKSLSIFSKKTVEEAQPTEEPQEEAIPEETISSPEEDQLLEEKEEETLSEEEIEEPVEETPQEKVTPELVKETEEPLPSAGKEVSAAPETELPSADELITQTKESFDETTGNLKKPEPQPKGPSAEELLAEAEAEPTEENLEKLDEEIERISKEDLPEAPQTYSPAKHKLEPVTQTSEVKSDATNVDKIKEELPSIKETPVLKEVTPEKKSFFGKLKQTFTTKTISADKFDELFWDLEVVLLENNVSVEVIEKIKADLQEELVNKPLPRDVPKKIEETLKNTLTEILSQTPINLLNKIKDKKPFIIALFGINGSGKTTTTAKLAHYFQKNQLTTVLAACDTFRAAAIQQLEEHATKLNTKIIKQDYGSDAAAVAFDAIKYAEKNQIDVVLIDTAGRLHSNTNLMDELKKLVRVANPDLKIFVGESITGNDCIEQAQKFQEIVELDGSILTKVDVDEKGGAPLSISYVTKKPILFLGSGQEYDNLEPFQTETILKRLGF